jgi:hypothetical protein
VGFLDPAGAVPALQVRAGLIGAAFADLAAVIDGDLPCVLGNQPDRGFLTRIEFPPARVDEREPRRRASLSRCSSSLCEKPAPSTVIIRFRRSPGGSAAIASSTRVTWSAAVFEPADPRRSIHASGSPVLSQNASSG